MHACTDKYIYTTLLFAALSDDEKEILVMMDSAAKFMAETLDNVLSMQKIEEGKLELEYQSFSPINMIGDIISMYGGMSKDNNIKINVIVGANVPEYLYSDSHKLSHVISNLISNALKFAPSGSVVELFLNSSEIRIQMEEGCEAQEALISFSVRDQGPGISEVDKKLLFKSFIQIRPGVLQKGRGSGLGLSFCKKVVHLLGGTISVESDGNNTGSTFKFEVPMKIVPGPVAHIRQTITNDETVVNFISPSFNEDMTKCRLDEVLIVDDVVSNCKLLGMIMKKMKIKSTYAENGKVAVELILKDFTRFKVIFMDNLMPELNGPEVKYTYKLIFCRFLRLHLHILFFLLLLLNLFVLILGNKNSPSERISIYNNWNHRKCNGR